MKTKKYAVLFSWGPNEKYIQDYIQDEINYDPEITREEVIQERVSNEIDLKEFEKEIKDYIRERVSNFYEIDFKIIED